MATFQSSGHFLKPSIQHGLKQNNNKKEKGSRSIVEHKDFPLTPANSTDVPSPLRHRSLDSVTEQKYKTKSTSTTSLLCSIGTFVPEKKRLQEFTKLIFKTCSPLNAYSISFTRFDEKHRV